MVHCFYFRGGAELLFDGVKKHQVTLPCQPEPCEYQNLLDNLTVTTNETKVVCTALIVANEDQSILKALSDMPWIRQLGKQGLVLKV